MWTRHTFNRVEIFRLELDLCPLSSENNKLYHTDDRPNCRQGCSQLLPEGESPGQENLDFRWGGGRAQCYKVNLFLEIAQIIGML